MSPPVYRFAVLCSSPYPKRWEMEIAAALARSRLAAPVVFWTVPRSPPRTLVERFWRARAERWAASLAPIDPAVVAPAVPVVALGETATPALADEGVDFVIDFSSAGAGDPAMRSAPLGRWFLRIGGQSSRGADIGTLTAFCSGESAVQVELVRSDGESDEQVLYGGRFGRRQTFIKTLDSVLFGIAGWYVVAGRKIAAGQAGVRRRSPAEPAAPWAVAALAAHAHRWFDAQRKRYTLEIWNIGLAPRPAIETLALGGIMRDVTWMTDPPGLTFRSDPFGWTDGNGETWVAHERFDYRTGKGILDLARFRGDFTGLSFEVFADLPVHASYPYLLLAQGQLLCLPEVNESGQTLMFTIETSPPRLKHALTLLKDVPMSDGTIFHFGEYHWLFGTRADADSQLRLYAWFATSLRGPWTPHLLNPIKCDITSARPAGTPFWAGGSLIRPAQDCSRSYGSAITLNRIVALSPTEFHEETVGRIEPDPDGPYPDGIHTLSFVGESVLVDGKRHEFRWNAARLNRNFMIQRHLRKQRLKAQKQSAGSSS
jgi:hypothetical protein